MRPEGGEGARGEAEMGPDRGSGEREAEGAGMCAPLFEAVTFVDWHDHPITWLPSPTAGQLAAEKHSNQLHEVHIDLTVQSGRKRKRPESPLQVQVLDVPLDTLPTSVHLTGSARTEGRYQVLPTLSCPLLHSSCTTSRSFLPVPYCTISSLLLSIGQPHSFEMHIFSPFIFHIMYFQYI